MLRVEKWIIFRFYNALDGENVGFFKVGSLCARTVLIVRELS
jgi:hypothetical protein